MTRYELPAQFTTGTEVASIRYGHHYTDAPTVTQGKITKVTKAQVTVEFTNGAATYGAATYASRYVADYASQKETSLTEYGMKNSYRNGETLVLANDERLVAIAKRADKANRERAIRAAAQSFTSGTPTVEEAEKLQQALTAFITASK